MTRRLTLLLLCLLLSLGAAACGVKPKKLDGGAGFPASYPQE
jgi:hypothetical protein